eukprot:3238655-Rhodomonas_salina.5
MQSDTFTDVGSLTMTGTDIGAVRCPVLTWGMPRQITMRCSAMSVTDLAYAATRASAQSGRKR